MSEPSPSASSRVWIDQFNQHFLDWLRAGRVQDQPLLEAAGALQNWLARAPEHAALVQTTALTATFNARLAAGPDATAALARVGHDADLLLHAVDPARASARVLLELYLAEAELRRREQYGGLAALQRAEQLISDRPPAPRLAAFLDGFLAFLRGQLSELGLAYAKAAGAYAAAAASLDPLTASVDALVDAGDALIELLFGPNPPGSADQVEQMFLLASNQIRIVASRNAIGRIRVQSALGPAPDLERQASDAWAVVVRCGLPQEEGPCDLAPMVAALPAEEADRTATLLVKKAGSGDAPAWQAVLFAALLARFRDASSRTRARWQRSLAAATAKVADPVVVAFVKSRALGPAPTPAARREFLLALEDLSRAQTNALDDLRTRAMFDDALAACVQNALTDCQRDTSQAARTELAVLLDALRGSNWGEMAALAGQRDDEALTAARLLALDRLQRIAFALRAHPDALAIVFQKAGDAFVFVRITGDMETPIEIVSGSPAFDLAARDLTGAVERALDVAVRTGALPAGDAVTPAGVAAFAALPAALRSLIASHRTLLIVPDYRGKSDDIPIEMLHDGVTHLGRSHVIARFTSVRALTRAVEHLSRRVPRKRAIVAAAANVGPPWPELPLARTEIERVRTTLVDTDWDVPAIDEARLTAAFLVERLEYLSWLHVSAHGQVAVDEAIVLPAGEQFTTDDLLRRRYPRLPGAYLNTCSLGQTRYVGAGVSRGIAHTLVEAGASVAIANLLPVADSAALDLAVGFYRHAATDPAGEALRRSRDDLAGRGVPPILWGTTVLIGDPWDTLEPADRPTGAAEGLLDAYFKPAATDADRADAVRKAAIALVADRDDVRLGGAVTAVQLASKITHADTPAERRQLDQLIGLVDQLDHAAAMATLRVVRITLASPAAAERRWQIEDTLRHLEPLSRADSSWNGWLTRVQTMAGQERPNAPKLVRRDARRRP